jgi:hypothetical protein
MTSQPENQAPPSRGWSVRPWLLVLAGLAVTACLVIWFLRLAAITDLLNLVPRAPDRERFTVSASEGWQATKVQIEAGNQVTIQTVGGSWAARPAIEDEDNLVGGEGYPGEYRRDAPVPSAPVGALLGRVDTGAPFRVGQRLQFVAARPGTLSFRINDTTLDDNRGRLRVEVVIVYPTPEPSLD